MALHTFRCVAFGLQVNPITFGWSFHDFGVGLLVGRPLWHLVGPLNFDFAASEGCGVNSSSSLMSSRVECCAICATLETTGGTLSKNATKRWKFCWQTMAYSCCSLVTSCSKLLRCWLCTFPDSIPEVAARTLVTMSPTASSFYKSSLERTCTCPS